MNKEKLPNTMEEKRALEVYDKLRMFHKGSFDEITDGMKEYPPQVQNALEGLEAVLYMVESVVINAPHEVFTQTENK